MHCDGTSDQHAQLAVFLRRVSAKPGRPTDSYRSEGLAAHPLIGQVPPRMLCFYARAHQYRSSWQQDAYGFRGATPATNHGRGSTGMNMHASPSALTVDDVESRLRHGRGSFEDWMDAVELSRAHGRWDLVDSCAQRR